MKNVTLQLLDKDFDVVDECSLNNYINVDFAKLTEMKPVTQEKMCIRDRLYPAAQFPF